MKGRMDPRLCQPQAAVRDRGATSWITAPVSVVGTCPITGTRDTRRAHAPALHAYATKVGAAASSSRNIVAVTSWLPDVGISSIQECARRIDEIEKVDLLGPAVDDGPATKCRHNCESHKGSRARPDAHEEYDWPGLTATIGTARPGD